MVSKLARLVGTLAMVAVVAMPAAAATHRYRRAAHPYPVAQANPDISLTIRKRSYLDAGVVVPVGSESAYVAESTTIGAPYVVHDLLHQRYDGWRADKFSIPGSPEPLIQFETPGAPY